ncbi:MAG: rhodanese-like domain-containing protein [Acidobacteria bacterium]|nr:rhodanese-like domain-containing protein [Acidobacteriota bacterium]
MRSIMLCMVAAVSLCQAAVIPLNQGILKGYLKNGAPFDFILIDIRDSKEIYSVIGNTACKPYNLSWPAPFKDEIVKIPKDRAIILYCRTGNRSQEAAEYLNNKGYSRVYDAGSFLTWFSPTVPPSDIKPASLLPAPSMRAKK